MSRIVAVAACPTGIAQTRMAAEALEETAALGPEGAIPFTGKDPAPVIPSFIAGSVVTGAPSMNLGSEVVAPYGGIFVLAIPNAVTNLAGHAIAIVVGTAIITSC